MMTLILYNSLRNSKQPLNIMLKYLSVFRSVLHDTVKGPYVGESSFLQGR